MSVNFWRDSGGPAPWGPLSVGAALNFSDNLAAWLASAGPGQNLTLVSAAFVDHDGLEIAAPSITGAVVTTRIDWALPDPPPELGTFYSFRLEWLASDGQRDERTFNLCYVQR